MSSSDLNGLTTIILLIKTWKINVLDPDGQCAASIVLVSL